MGNICVGVVAHVDSGKTTLTEQILYNTGSIRKAGRVDHRDTFFDTAEMERARGITIFSKQADFCIGEKHFSLIDTPGHVDFTAETERCLSILDYAVLIISAPEGLQQHTFTLWKLLKRYEIPVFVFINKMDREGSDKSFILKELNTRLENGFFELSDTENIAMLSDSITEKYFETGNVSLEDTRNLIFERKLFPCIFGSALFCQGVDELLDTLEKYSLEKHYEREFSAICYKITRDSKNNRYSYLKITGGSLKVKDILEDEKVEQLFSVSGTSLKPVQEAFAGDTVAVTGLKESFSGKIYGKSSDRIIPEQIPLFTAGLIPNTDKKPSDVYLIIKPLEEEYPEISLSYDEKHDEIGIKLMGDIQTEILTTIIKERFGIDVSFSESSLVYKETVRNECYGVGHYEPLKHYAEVHVVISPGKRGSGIEISSEMNTDDMPLHFQRLILSHFAEKKHKGVLTGSELTDVSIKLVNGKYHLKHTEGGDFRQAAYRAVRNALMFADNVLLEPYYSYEISVPQGFTGRIMTDLSNMAGKFTGPDVSENTSKFFGNAPVSQFQPYIKTLMQFTGGSAEVCTAFDGYGDCHNQESIVLQYNYNPEADVKNQPGSVFCEHGAGLYVPWNEVRERMHLEMVTGSEK